MASAPNPPRTVDRGPFRIALEANDDPRQRNVYFEVEVANGWAIDTHVVFVRDSRIAFNNASRRHGHNLLGIRNLETGRQVVGGTH